MRKPFLIAVLLCAIAFTAKGQYTIPDFKDRINDSINLKTGQNNSLTVSNLGNRLKELADIVATLNAGCAWQTIANYKQKVDDSITTRTTFRSVSPNTIGNRIKELADVVQLVKDSCNGGSTGDDSAIYAYIDSVIADISAGVVSWSSIQDKPTEFPPEAHTHAQSEVTGLVDALAGKSDTGHTHAYSSLTGIPTTFSPSAHTHAQSEVVGLTDSIAAKSNTGHTHAYSSLTGIPSTFAPSTHSHPVNQVTGLQDSLNLRLTVETDPAFTTSDAFNITSTNKSNWTAAYNDKINSGAVTGTGTKTVTLTQQDGGTVTFNFTDQGVTVETDPLSPHKIDSNTYAGYVTLAYMLARINDTANTIRALIPTLTAGANISFGGTPPNYIINAAGGGGADTYLGDGDSTTVTGDGSIGDPFRVNYSGSFPVTSVNSQTGAVNLDYSDVGAEPTIGYTTENVANKATDFSVINNTVYPSTQAVADIVADSMEVSRDTFIVHNTKIDGKEPAITATTSADYYRGDKTFQTLNKAAVGLANADNTSDATKNAATVTLTNKTIDGDDNTFQDIPQSAVTGLTTDLAGKQPLDADLTTISGLSPSNDDILQRKAGAWANRTVSQFKTDLALIFSDIGSTPTTLAGYGITDAAGISHTHTFASLTSKPTDLSGYGITDAVPNTRQVNGYALSGNITIGPADITQTSSYRFVTDAEKSTWNGKQNALGFTAGNVANPLSQFAATTSSQLAGVVSDETGSGALVFGTSPTLTTPALGTPSALVLTNATGLPVGGISATGTPSSSTALYGDGTWKVPTRYNVLVIAISDETTDLTTGTAKATFRMPAAATITAVRASVNTVSSSGTPTFDINEAGTTILSTKITIDASEKTSTTAATAAVISDASIADDAEMTIDIDVAGTGTKGAKIAIYYTY